MQNLPFDGTANMLDRFKFQKNTVFNCNIGSKISNALSSKRHRYWIFNFNL